MMTLSILSCEKSSESISRTCSFNDKPIDCSALDNRPTGPQLSTSDFPDSVRVSGRISYKRDGNKIIYLEDEHFEAVFEGKNSKYTCSLDFKKGDYILIKSEKYLLKITNSQGNQSVMANRKENSFIDENDYLLGDYFLNRNFGGQVKLGSTFTFSAYELEMETFCYPKLDKN